MTPHRRRGHPVSTYRLQLHRGFGFTDARDVVPYLSRLGITDCYSSPHLKANPGSTHGYDICDHRELNPELGRRSDYEAFSAALVAHDLGHVVDIVPNHMAADPASNPWWRDVLENGPSSPYRDFFDIDWQPVKSELTDRILLPILGDQYGLVLERGELEVQFAAGTLTLQYGAMNLPLNPRQHPRILGLPPDVVGHVLDPDTPDTREYLSILTALGNLPPYTERDPDRIAERQRERDVARERLGRLATASPEVRAHIDACVSRVNGVAGDPRSFDLLHELLERQAYRLAYWRTAFDEINYRRFFDVNGLVGLRMEHPGVFEATHALLSDLVAAGHITGFRVDHPDGLFDPKQYLERLQEMARGARARLADPDGVSETRPFYVVVEKILSFGERLRDDWVTDGTTGYDFLNEVAGLFVDGRHARKCRRIYARMTGEQAAFEDVAFQCKRVITLTSMASELSVLARELNRLSERDRRYRDFTLDSCRKALREVLAGCPVYRTYVSGRGADAFDRTAIEVAIAEARRRNPVMEESIFRFIHDALLPADPPGGNDRDARGDRLHFAMKFQQFSAPVQAKGVEDTAFYRYHVLVAANDVGGHPGRLGLSVQEFHEANARRRSGSMLATSTHDTKRGEDARVRLAALSEIPDEWRRAVSEWARLNARHRSRVGTRWAPDRNDEYLFYQAALGAWPSDVMDAPVPGRAPEDFVQRINAYMQKAIREAKVHTSWIDQDPEYGRAVSTFVTRALTSTSARRFLASFVPFARRLAAMGAVNSLAQLALKLTSPGVPDFYQGTELWDLSLVDPDNRRPVDFVERQRILESIEPMLVRAGDGGSVVPELGELLDAWPDGRVKCFMTACGLHLRRQHADFFLSAVYLPLEVHGPAETHVVAFARHDQRNVMVTVVPRLIGSLVPGLAPSRRNVAWQDTRVVLPPELGSRTYRQVFTGELVEPANNVLPVSGLLQNTPVAVAWGE